ncbi:hypothetical protein D9M70_627900 [compost metagenome]
MLAQHQFAALRRDQRELDAARYDDDHIVAFVAALEDHRARRPLSIGGDLGKFLDRLLVEPFEDRE